MRNFKICQASNVFLISFADDLLKGPVPLPLRRVFSLMRFRKFESLIYTAEICDLNHDHKNECGPHYQSCNLYRNTLDNKQFKYDYKLEEKTCFKFYFFNSALKT